MSITASSSLTDIYNANPYSLTSTDKANLYNITMTTNQIVGIGLAGFDLTGIYADCAVATDNCVASTYNPFDGYALVGQLFDETSDTTNSFGACFPDLSCFTINPTGTNYAFNTLVTSAASSATVPNSMTSDAVAASKCETNTGGFDAQCFGFIARPVTDRQALVWRFEQTDASDRYEVGQVVQVVGIDTTSVAAGSNVVASVTLAGAAALTAAAASAALSTILF